ncbi:MAG: hypothetical protein CVU44_01200 [Chloroflexi bacterium HGW-Chloroflexi-6]|nr:MAG: hypothetical protein CVU44_01200 [Chloroflexi bacterium HGW-Chloroflexi-6]
MNKRLSFTLATIIAISTVFLVGAIEIWLKLTLNWPGWVLPILSIVPLYLYWEIVGQLGPKEFETPTAKFLKLSTRDKTVLSIAFLTFLIIALPIGTSFTLVWLKFMFFGVGALIFWGICVLFGSKELIQLVPKHKNSTRSKTNKIV